MSTDLSPIVGIGAGLLIFVMLGVLAYIEVYRAAERARKQDYEGDEFDLIQFWAARFAPAIDRLEDVVVLMDQAILEVITEAEISGGGSARCSDLRQLRADFESAFEEFERLRVGLVKRDRRRHDE